MSMKRTILLLLFLDACAMGSNAQIQNKFMGAILSVTSKATFLDILKSKGILYEEDGPNVTVMDSLSIAGTTWDVNCFHFYNDKFCYLMLSMLNSKRSVESFFVEKEKVSKKLKEQYDKYLNQ